MMKLRGCFLVHQKIEMSFIMRVEKPEKPSFLELASKIHDVVGTPNLGLDKTITLVKRGLLLLLASKR